MSDYPRERFPIPGRDQIQRVDAILDGVRDLTAEELRDLVQVSLSSFYALANILMYVRHATDDEQLKEQVAAILSQLDASEEAYRQAIGPRYAEF